MFTDLARPEILRELGRKLLASFFDSFRDDLAANGLFLPPAEASDEAYFHALAACLQSPARLPRPMGQILRRMEKGANPKIGHRVQDLDTVLAQGLELSPDSAAELMILKLWLIANRPSPPQPPRGAPYALRMGLGFWKLTFNGQDLNLKHQQGLFYVACLLADPPSIPIHALDLLAKIPALYRKQLGITELIDPATGQSEVLESHARLQERNLSMEDPQTPRLLQRRQQELQALLADEAKSPSMKREALRELEEIAEFQTRYGRRSPDAASRAAGAVGKALRRLHARLLCSLDPRGNPAPLLLAFAEHLDLYLLRPSARYSRCGGRFARTGLAGCFTYEPPPGIVWIT